MEHILVNAETAIKIINDRKPLGTFWHREKSLYIAIDNTTGDAWTEEFKTKKECFDYLNGAE